MKQLAIILIFLFSGLTLFAQQEKSYVKKGNELYQQKRYKEAEAAYRQSVAKKEQNVPGNFNLGDALYKQKQYDKAGEQFKRIAESNNNNKAVLAHAYHNLGNSMLQSQKYQESVDAYKKALLNNPKDDETRYNLVYAQQKLKQQQQQNKGKNKDNKDQQKQNQDKKDQDKKNNDQNKDKQKQDQQKQQQQPQPNNISKDDAQRMLDALNNDEKQTQDKLKNKKARGTTGRPAKDW